MPRPLGLELLGAAQRVSKREEEGRGVGVPSLGGAEAHVSEAPEEPATLPGPDEHEEACRPITPFVEGFGAEAMGGGAVHLLPRAGVGGTAWGEH